MLLSFPLLRLMKKLITRSSSSPHRRLKNYSRSESEKESIGFPFFYNEDYDRRQCQAMDLIIMISSPIEEMRMEDNIGAPPLLPVNFIFKDQVPYYPWTKQTLTLSFG